MRRARATTKWARRRRCVRDHSNNIYNYADSHLKTYQETQSERGLTEDEAGSTPAGMYYVLRSVDLWVKKCVNPASSLPLAAGAFLRNSLPINVHISVHGENLK